MFQLHKLDILRVIDKDTCNLKYRNNYQVFKICKPLGDISLYLKLIVNINFTEFTVFGGFNFMI